MFYLTFAHHAFDRSSHNNVDTPAFSGMEIKEMLLMERADRVPYPWGARLTELEVKTTAQNDICQVWGHVASADKVVNHTSNSML